MKAFYKKLALCGMLALAQIGQNLNADDCCDTSCDYDCCSSWYAVFENVIVKPHFSRNNAYFLDSPPGISGQKAKQFDWDYCYSPRFELGWNGNCGYGARVRYWFFDDETTEHAKDANGNIASFFAEDSSPNDIGFDGSTEARFKHGLELNVLDLEATFERCNWVFSIGARYATIDQHYKGENLSGAEEVMKSDHDFDGWGLTASAEFMQPIKCGFSIFTKGRGSLLYGDSKWKAYNDDPAADDYLSSKNKNDLQAIGELQVGIDWRKCFCGDKIGFIRIAAEAQYWANGGAAGPGDNAVYDEGNYQNTHPQDSVLGLIGVNIAIGAEF